ncbi:MAG: hypothetical protein JST54_19950 [Deltaproteobacteria bacterium]|nr:hypothetical protein [Deltaproteobacteria bacterium]
MIAFATQAVRELGTNWCPEVASTLSVRDRLLFAVCQIYDDQTPVRESARAIMAELDSAHAERVDLERCFTRVNLRLQAHLAACHQPMGGGASLIAASVNANGRAMLAHVGEVTAFRVHDGGVERLCIPHTLEDERKQRSLPDWNVSRVLLRSLGSPNWRPDVVTFELVPGDRLALMTREVADVTPHGIRAEILRGPLEIAAQKLVDALPHNRVGACVVVNFEA